MTNLKTTGIALAVLTLCSFEMPARSAAYNEKTANAVVTVQVLDEKGRKVGHGSGFVVKPNGEIVTNEHVIRNAERAEILFKNGERRPVVGVVAYDTERDIAVLKIDATNLPALPLAEADSAKVGTVVVAAGAPIDLPNTFTTGTISAIRVDTGATHRVIQHSATIAPGSSGGPLLDESGKVLGINTYIKSNRFYFAVPAQYIRTALGGKGSPKSLKAFRQEKIEALTRALMERIKSDEHYYSYQDELPFGIRLPKGYLASRREWIDDKETRHVTFLVAPHDALPTKANSWLKEGIRIDFALPPEGREWKPAWLKEQVEKSLKAMVGSYTKHEVLEELNETNFGDLKALAFTVVGENPGKIEEPEIGAGFLIARPEYFVTAEVTAPLSKENTYLELRLATLTFQTK